MTAYRPRSYVKRTENPVTLTRSLPTQTQEFRLTLCTFAYYSSSKILPDESLRPKYIYKRRRKKNARARGYIYSLRAANKSVTFATLPIKALFTTHAHTSFAYCTGIIVSHLTDVHHAHLPKHLKHAAMSVS